MSRVPVRSPPEYEPRLDWISLEGVSRGLGPRVYRRLQLGNGAKGETGSHPFVGESRGRASVRPFAFLTTFISVMARTFLTMVKHDAIGCCRARSRTTSTTCTSFRRWTLCADLQCQLHSPSAFGIMGGCPTSTRIYSGSRSVGWSRTRYRSPRKISEIRRNSPYVPLTYRSLGRIVDDTLKANRRSPLLCSAAVRGESSRSGSALATEMSLSTPLGAKVPCTYSTCTLPVIDHADYGGL